MIKKLRFILASMLMLYGTANADNIIWNSNGKSKSYSIENKIIEQPKKMMVYEITPQIYEKGVNLNALRGKITYIFENENSSLFLQSSITNRGSYIMAKYDKGNTIFDFQTDIKFIKFHRISGSEIFPFIKPEMTARFKVTFPLYLPF